jgi:hypothetical protein
LGLRPTAGLRDRSPRASEADSGTSAEEERSAAGGRPGQKRLSFLGERRRRPTGNGASDDDDDGEEGEDRVIYAHDLPDDKLVGLLGACLRTPKHLRKDAAAGIHVGVKVWDT